MDISTPLPKMSNPKKIKLFSYYFRLNYFVIIIKYSRSEIKSKSQIMWK